MTGFCAKIQIFSNNHTNIKIIILGVKIQFWWLSKYRILVLAFLTNFPIKRTGLVTLFDRNIRFSKTRPNWQFFMIFCPLASLAILNETFSLIFKHCENVLQKSEMKKKCKYFLHYPKKQLVTPSSFFSWSNYVIALGQVLWRVSPNWL